MVIIGTLSDKIKASVETIKREQNNIKELSLALSEHVRKEHPLSKYIGKTCIYHRVKWGHIDGRGQPLSSALINRHDHLIAENIIIGSEMNEKYDTMFFKTDSHYLVYSSYEDDFDEDEEMNLRQVYDFIAVEI